MSESDDLIPSDLSQQVFKARVAGLSEYVTAKRFGIKPSEVRRIVDQMAPRVTAQTRMTELRLQLVRLDALEETFFQVAIEERCPQAAAICLKVGERKSAVMGWDYAPLRTDQATLTVIRPEPRPNSTQQIRAALARLAAEKPQPAPEPIEAEIIEPEPAP